MTIEIYIAYVLACALITIIPGPTVTVIIANSLAHGTRAGLLNVAGTQLGLGLMMAILGVTAMVVALFSDGAYAVLTGRAGVWLSRKRIRLVSRVSGCFLIGGGVWLALSRSR